MANVKIFVSHRIDLKSVPVENSVYVPVRCGAALDDDPAPSMAGDNTGKNISDKRSYLGEFTIQYWAWKNVQADYYGICHYRRYLSFSDKEYPVDEKNQVVEPYLSASAIKKYGLDDPEAIEKVVSKYDAVVAEYADISEMFTPKGPRSTLYKHFSAYDKYLIEKSDIDLFLDTLERLYPAYGESAREYFAGKKFRGYNCFILKRELFFQMCQMEVDVLKAIYETGEIDLDRRSTLEMRTYGFFCEWMYGIFLYHLEKMKKYKIKYTQLVFFEHTEVPEPLAPVENAIPVVFLTDAYWLPATQTAIQSLLDHRRAGTRYDIIIGHVDLKKEQTKSTTQYFGDFPDVSVRFLNLEQTIPESSEGVHWHMPGDPTRLIHLLPWILGKYDRFIFLHSDALPLTDLTGVFATNLGACYLAAPRDYLRTGENRRDEKIRNIRQQKLFMEDPDNFFSSAIMVVDAQAIRKDFSYDTCLRYAFGNYFSQDILNRLFGNHALLLPAPWGACVKEGFDVEVLSQYVQRCYADELKKASEAPLVLHYPFSPKPWQNPYHEESARFWVVARKVPLYEQLIAHLSAGGQGAERLPQAPKESLPRRVAGVFFPKGTARRELLKKILPKGSARWDFCKKIYYFLTGKKMPKSEE